MEKEKIKLTIWQKRKNKPMKKPSLCSPIHLLLISLVFIMACNTQNKSTLPENNPNNYPDKSKPFAIHTYPKVNEPPRVDSVLQFSTMVTAILEDSKGNFWFGSHGDGVCRYGPSTRPVPSGVEEPPIGRKQFTYFTAKQGLPSYRFHKFDDRKVPMGNLIRSIQEDQSGNIWIRTADGFCKYDANLLE